MKNTHKYKNYGKILIKFFVLISVLTGCATFTNRENATSDDRFSNIVGKVFTLKKDAYLLDGGKGKLLLVMPEVDIFASAKELYLKDPENCKMDCWFEKYGKKQEHFLIDLVLSGSKLTIKNIYSETELLSQEIIRLQAQLEYEPRLSRKIGPYARVDVNCLFIEDKKFRNKRYRPDPEKISENS